MARGPGLQEAKEEDQQDEGRKRTSGHRDTAPREHSWHQERQPQRRRVTLRQIWLVVLLLLVAMMLLQAVVVVAVVAAVSSSSCLVLVVVLVVVVDMKWVVTSPVESMWRVRRSVCWWLLWWLLMMVVHRHSLSAEQLAVCPACEVAMRVERAVRVAR